MNKESTQDFKVVAPAGITVITAPVHFDVNTIVTLNKDDQRTIDQLAAGEIEVVDLSSEKNDTENKGTEGDVTNEDGSVTHADGTVSHADGSVTDAEGAVIQLPLGEGEVRNEDGSVTRTDGTTLHIDGSVTGADGQPVVVA